MRPRKTASTAEAVALSIAATRVQPLRLLWATRTSPYVELTDGVRRYDIEPLLGALPLERTAGARPWPEVAAMLRARLGIRLQTVRVSYLLAHRVEASEEERAPLYDLGRVMEDLRVEAPEQWGFAQVAPGQGPLPKWLHYLREPHGAMARIHDLYSKVIRMRLRHGVPTTIWGWRTQIQASPRTVLRGMRLAPEIWVRRRICRNSEVVSLSLYGVAEVSRGQWMPVDLTAPLALHCAAAELSPTWRRGVYLVERGDGLEWIVLRPSVDGMDDSLEYEGSPARYLHARLAEIWPKVRVRWILDDRPLRGEGDLR